MAYRGSLDSRITDAAVENSHRAVGRQSRRPRRRDGQRGVCGVWGVGCVSDVLSLKKKSYTLRGANHISVRVCDAVLDSSSLSSKGIFSTL